MLPSLCETFLHQLVALKGRAESTRARYAEDLALWAEFLQEHDSDVLKATRRHINDWLTDCRIKRDNQAVTLRRKISCLRSFYKWCMVEEYLPSSPADGVELPKLPQRKAIYLKPYQVKALLGAILREPDDGANAEAWSRTWRRDLTMIKVMLYQGLRISEVIGLSWPDVDFENGSLLVLGKGAKERQLPLHSQVYEALMELRQSGPTSSSAIFVATMNPNPDAPIGDRLKRQAASQAITKYITRAHLKDDGITTHKLRHTFASTLLNNGADIKDIADQLGHASLQSTSIYVHSSGARQRELVEKVKY